MLRVECQERISQKNDSHSCNVHQKQKNKSQRLLSELQTLSRVELSRKLRLSISRDCSWQHDHKVTETKLALVEGTIQWKLQI